MSERDEGETSVSPATGTRVLWAVGDGERVI